MRDSYRDSYNSNNRPFSFGETAGQSIQPPTFDNRVITTTNQIHSGAIESSRSTVPMSQNRALTTTN